MFACGEQASAPRAAEPEGVDALDAYLRDAFPADEPGIAVMIARGDEVVFSRGYGLADLDTGEPIGASTLFNVGSLSKTFVAGAVLILVERGELSLDDPLSKYFPDFKHPELAQRVQLQHLLTHTSGLPDNRPVEEEREFYLTARDAENWYPITQADALEFEPGSRYAYFNPGFNALALIVEQVTGKKWQAFVRDEIFLPSGMLTSTITDGPHPETGVAHGYRRWMGQWRENDYGEVPTFAAAGNGGVWSSVAELRLYERALQRAVFLSAETIADARTVKTFDNWASDAPPEIGWSWFITEAAGRRHIGHTGGQGGFSTNYFVIPDKDLHVAFILNNGGGLRETTDEIYRWLGAAGYLD